MAKPYHNRSTISRSILHKKALWYNLNSPWEKPRKDKMSPENTNSPTKVCPTCGTRLPENATRCLVCGRNFSVAMASPSTSAKTVQGPRLPEIKLSLPAAIGVFILLLGIGAAIVYGVLKGSGRVVVPTPTLLPTKTATITLTPTSSVTPSPVPTFTPLPPLEYSVKSLDNCLTIAYAFKVSSQSIILLNNLSADCNNLVVGQKLKIPQPTPTPSPQPSATLSESQSTDEACSKADYTVKEGDTLGGIAANYNVTMEAIRTYNGLPGDVVRQGQVLHIPLCARKPTAGPTPTATPPPPYPAANLLLPADGAPFMSATDVITLQWASIGTLRTNESYSVVVEDVTEGTGRKLIDYVTDTKYIIPAQFRPSGNIPHVIRWYIQPVRQVGSDKVGKPQWDTAGIASTPRVFTWWGGGNSITPTP